MSKLPNLRVAVVATDGFEETELTTPVAALRDAGAEVTILSLEPGQIQAVRHDLEKTIQVNVDRPISEVSADDFDAVHLPGGAVKPTACVWTDGCRGSCKRCRRRASPSR